MTILRLLRSTISTIVLVSSLAAQSGDRPNEVQRPVPPEWKIPPAPVLSPDEALRSLTVAPGFRVELAAAEPLTGDPVAAAFGPDGRLWVVEMRSYMPDIDGTGEDEPIGSVAVLEDTDADGKYDKRTVFLDRLKLPRAVSLVDDGVLIAEPPHLWFARDTNGDSIADSKVEIASDYGGVGNPEHMANGLVWMMDNWIYSANHTTRYRYEGNGKFTSEATITRGQWGITQDDGGRIYYNSNSDPLRFDAVPSAYLARNPHLASRTGTNVQLAPAKLPTWPGRITPGVNRGYQNLRPDGTLTTVTAACSPVIYRSDLFPTEFRGDAFICEPSGNLVKRIRLTEQNGVPLGTNAYERTEFLTSTDERFRPVSAYNGPEGALYIVDMSRGVIQHRTYVTSYLRAQVKERRLEEGRGLGRIWRIVPATARPPSALPNLTLSSTIELVQHLRSPSGWVRDTAQRLLVEKHVVTAIEPLQELVRSHDAPAFAKLHALWTLEGIGALDRSSVLSALTDNDAQVCAAAIRLSEKWLRDASDKEIFRRVTTVKLPTGAELSQNVILQQALSLGEATSPDKHAAMSRLAEDHGNMPFVADALVSGLAGQEEVFIEALRGGPGDNAAPVIASAVGTVLNSGSAERALPVLATIADPATRPWARRAILDGIDLFIPRRADRTRAIGSLPFEPVSLMALAALKDDPERQRATDLLEHLRWPGKAGEPPAAVPLTAEETQWFESGKLQYAALCANCHQPEGQGLQGLAPPLVNSRWVLGPAPLAASIILCGKEDEGKIMPALRAVLDDAAIANVLTFVRNSWGHSAKPVSVETIAGVRAKTAARTEPFSEAELIEISGTR